MRLPHPRGGVEQQSPLQVLPSRQPNVVAIQMKDPRIKLGAKLGLAIKKDMPSLFGTKLPEAAKADFQVSSEKAISTSPFASPRTKDYA